MYLTTIAEGNELALKLLTSGRAGLPTYHPAGVLHTFALPVGCRRKKPIGPGITIRTAGVDDLPSVLAHLRTEGPRRQFFPCYEESDFFTAHGLLRGLRPDNLLLAFQGNRLVGSLGTWDQSAFRQTKVQGYSGLMRWLRPWYNLAARLRNRPALPGPGAPIRYLMAALFVVRGDDAKVAEALLDEALARAARGTFEYLLVGLCTADPLLPVAASYRGRCYTTRLFHVCWEDGEPFRQRLDGRPAYLELGSL